MSTFSSSTEVLPLHDWAKPKHGISFTREQADILIHEHLNMTIKSFECIDFGYYNLIYFIDTMESANQYVLKVSGQYWVRIKTEAEVKALELLAKYTTIPAPKVIAYSSDRSNQYGVEWILMTRLPGENMSEVCEEQVLSPKAMQSIIRDLADIVSQMHWKVPPFNHIGAFTRNGEIGTDLLGRGPWSSHEQFIRGRAQAGATVLQDYSVFAPIREPMLNAIDQLEKLPLPSFAQLPFVFSHGDLDAHNILISMADPDAPRITGIVDWEWAGSFPCSEEFFTSFYSFLYHENEDIPNLFLDELERRNVLTPRTIEHFSLIEKLNRFTRNLVLWDLVDLVNPDDPKVSKKLERSLGKVESTLEELQDELHSGDNWTIE